MHDTNWSQSRSAWCYLYENSHFGSDHTKRDRVVSDRGKGQESAKYPGQYLMTFDDFFFSSREIEQLLSCSSRRVYRALQMAVFKRLLCHFVFP